MLVTDTSSREDRIAMFSAICDGSLLGKTVRGAHFRGAYFTGKIVACRMRDEYCGVISVETPNPWNKNEIHQRELVLHVNLLSSSSREIFIF